MDPTNSQDVSLRSGVVVAIAVAVASLDPAAFGQVRR